MNSIGRWTAGVHSPARFGLAFHRSSTFKRSGQRVRTTQTAPSPWRASWSIMANQT